MKEKRRFARVSPEPADSVEIHIMGSDFLDVLKVKDISLGGAQIIVPHQFEGCKIDNAVEVLLKLPHRKPFTTTAQIKHKIKDNEKNEFFGVQFSKLTFSQKELLGVYINEQLANKVDLKENH